jgi:hypothetical protein
MDQRPAITVLAELVPAGWLYDQEVGNIFRTRWVTKWINRQPGEMPGIRNIRQIFTTKSLETCDVCQGAKVNNHHQLWPGRITCRACNGVGVLGV